MNAFLIQHQAGLILVDTGIGSAHPDIDTMYRPARYPLPEALASLGTAMADIRLVINSHLHFDHCGSNSLFSTTPIFVQSAEFKSAHERDYTIPEFFDFPAANYQLLDGPAEVARGITIVPTPGHTRGHQSVAVETEQGLIILAGQAAETAEDFELLQAESQECAASLRRLHDLAPALVYFSHDRTIWKRPS